MNRHNRNSTEKSMYNLNQEYDFVNCSRFADSSWRKINLINNPWYNQIYLLINLYFTSLISLVIKFHTYNEPQYNCIFLIE